MAKTNLVHIVQNPNYTHLEYSVVCRIFDDGYAKIAKPMAKLHYAREQLRSFLSAIGLDNNLVLPTLKSALTLSYTDKTTPYKLRIGFNEAATRKGNNNANITIPGFNINLIVTSPTNQQNPDFVRRVLEVSDERFYFAHTLHDMQPKLQAIGYFIGERGRIVIKTGADVFRDYLPKDKVIHSRSLHRDCDDKMETIL